MDIKTKADVGQTVFYIEDRKVFEGKVKHIAININADGEFSTLFYKSTRYSLHGITLGEEDIFLSRKEIANAVLSGDL